MGCGDFSLSAITSNKDKRQCEDVLTHGRRFSRIDYRESIDPSPLSTNKKNALRE